MSFVRFARGIVFILGVRGLIGATPREKQSYWRLLIVRVEMINKPATINFSEGVQTISKRAIIKPRASRTKCGSAAHQLVHSD